MIEEAGRLIGNCFENLEKVEVLGSLLYEKFLGEKDTDVSLSLVLSFVQEAKTALLDLQDVLKNT